MSRSGRPGGDDPLDPDKDEGRGGAGGRGNGGRVDGDRGRGQRGNGAEPGDEPDEAGPDEDDDQVGYGRPPRHSRFGFGNKMGRGRRKGSRNIGTLFNAALDAKVTVKSEGRKRKRTKREIVVEQLINHALKNDVRAIVRVIELAERYGPRDEAEGLTAEQLQRDRDNLRNFLKLRSLWEGEDDE